MEKFLKEQYHLEVIDIKRVTAGVGGETFKVEAVQEKYIFKWVDANEMNRPKGEPEICNFLWQKGMAVSEFIANRSGKYVLQDEEGRYGYLQRYIEGKVFAMNTAPEWFIVALK